jgi:hypothetical protein
MRATTKLSMANNMLATNSNAKAAGEALGEVLKGSVILKELDVSGNAHEVMHLVVFPQMAQALQRGYPKAYPRTGL